MTRIYILLLLVSALVLSCASISAPSGGPDDTTPAEIVSNYPENASTNFKDSKIIIEFSEYMDKSSVTDNLRFSPDFAFTTSWSGTELEINIQDTLLPETTYCLSLDAKYRDAHSVPAASGFSLIFSTGSNIDSGKVSGKVYSKAEGYSVFAYRIDEINADTLDITRTKPNYYQIIGTSGEFTINALKNGTYRLVLVQDKNEDRLYNAGSEEYSSSNFDIEINQEFPVSGIVFYKAEINDTTKPEVFGIEAVSSRKIKLELSEPILPNTLQTNAFTIVDSLTETPFKAVLSYTDKKNESIYLISENKLIESKKYFIKYDERIMPADSNGNLLKFPDKLQYFSGSNIIDETKLSYEVSIKDSIKNIDLSPSFEVNFNLPLLAANSLKYEIVTLKKNVPAEVKIQNNKLYSISPISKLKPDSWYELRLCFENTKTYNDSAVKDTCIFLNFQTLDNRIFGSASGLIKIDSSGKIINGDYYITLSSEKNKKSFTIKADSSLKWKFDDLPEDEYTAEIYIDANQNGKYDCGRAFPYTYSEYYFRIGTKLKIVSRWKSDDVIFNIPKIGE